MTTVIDSVKPASRSFAQALFGRGTDFLDEDAVAASLNINLMSVRSPRFSEQMLDSAKQRGEQLLWLPSKDANDKPITMKRLHESFENKAPLGGKLLYDTDWYKNEQFFTTDTARVNETGFGSWRLAGTSAVHGTKGENFLRQTVIAAQYVTDEIYGGRVPNALKALLAEPIEREEELAALMREDWRKAGEVLSELPFNQKSRDTPIEAMMRVIANQHVNRFRPLENEYSWTNARSSYGCLVDFGPTDERGAGVDDWNPRGSNDYRGFFLSRSDTVESEM